MTEHAIPAPPVDSVAVFQTATRLLAVSSRIGAFGCCIAVADASKQHLGAMDTISVVAVLAAGCFAVRGQWLGPAMAALFAAAAVHYENDNGAMSDAFSTGGTGAAFLPLGLLLLSGACILEVLTTPGRRLPPARAALLVGAGCLAYGLSAFHSGRLLFAPEQFRAMPEIGPPWNGLLIAGRLVRLRAGGVAMVR